METKKKSKIKPKKQSPPPPQKKGPKVKRKKVKNLPSYYTIKYCRLSDCVWVSEGYAV